MMKPLYRYKAVVLDVEGDDRVRAEVDLGLGIRVDHWFKLARVNTHHINHLINEWVCGKQVVIETSDKKEGLRLIELWYDHPKLGQRNLNDQLQGTI